MCAQVVQEFSFVANPWTQDLNLCGQLYMRKHGIAILGLC